MPTLAHFIECKLFSPWYGLKIARLALNNNNNQSILVYQYIFKFMKLALNSIQSTNQTYVPHI